jgi:hypothetical protein
VENMPRNFGRKQTFIHNTLIKQKDSYLGPYPQILNPGDVQQERDEQCHDKKIEGRTIQRWLKKEELV